MNINTEIKPKLLSLTMAAGFAVCAAANAQAQTGTTPGALPSTATNAQPATGKANGVDAMDQTFFKKAAIGGMTEIEAGRLATIQSSSADIKSFGQMMVDDHTKVNDQLKELAAQKSVTLPSAPDDRHQAMLTSLKAKQGAAFDAEFLKDMQTGHADAIHAFTMASKSKDAEVANFATTTLPKLKEHQKMLASLKPALKTGSAESAAVAAR